MPKEYPPGSIGAQLQAKGVPEAEWGTAVSDTLDKNARVNALEKERRKAERRGVKDIAGGVVKRNPQKIVSGVRAMTKQQQYMNEILDTKHGSR